MKLWDILKTSASNLWRNKGRTFLTVIAVFIGAFTIALTSAVNSGVNDYIDRQLSIYGDDSVIYIRAKSAMEQFTTGPQEYKEGASEEQISGYSIQMLNSNDIKKISKIENVENAEIYTSASADYIQSSGSKKYKIALQSIAEGQNIQLDYLAGNRPQGIDEIVISQDYLEVLKFNSAEEAIGKTIWVSATNNITGMQKKYALKISGVLNKSLIQNTMGVISSELNDEIYSYNTEGLGDDVKNKGVAILAKIKGEKTDEKLEQIKKDADKIGYTVTTAKDQVQTIYDVVNAVTGALIVFGAIALLAASFGIINTLYMSVRERTREIGLMKAMGLSNRKVFALFSAEAILIGVIGSVLGILAAKGVGSVLNNFASQSFLKGLEGFNLTLFTLENSFAIVAIVAFIAFIAGALPSRSASRKDPIEALRYE